jgi:DNA modification methylase
MASKEADVWARIIIGDSRSMPEMDDATIDLVVTSPPYWHIKDYGTPEQIGYGASLHQYLLDLYRVWLETYRVLRPGARLCINIGDQFARATTYGRYKVIPLHSEIIGQCERTGYDFMGSIIWQKKTTMNTTGGATVMGSFPYPPNGIVELDYEYIHIFKKPGRSKRVSREIKEASRIGKQDWKEYFRGHWHFGGVRKVGHEAMFPLELPRRLIRMFSFLGDTVLDPFLGSGTTAKAALGLGRNAIGYEINAGFATMIRSKLGIEGAGRSPHWKVEIARRAGPVTPSPDGCVGTGGPPSGYEPMVQDVRPARDVETSLARKERLYRVTRILDPVTLELSGGLKARLAGVRVKDEEATLAYLRRYVSGKQVFLRSDDSLGSEDGYVDARVYLKNRIFVNGYLVRSGLCSPDPAVDRRLHT